MRQNKKRGTPNTTHKAKKNYKTKHKTQNTKEWEDKTKKQKENNTKQNTNNTKQEEFFFSYAKEIHAM